MAKKLSRGHPRYAENGIVIKKIHRLVLIFELAIYYEY